MKRLTTYISHMKDFHSLNEYLNEKLVVNKNYNPYTYVPTSFDELKEIIKQRYDEQGPGTKQKPINFNDIDVSNIDNLTGLFTRIEFKYIDVSDWNVSEVKDMRYIFYNCEKLKSIGDLSKWNVSHAVDMRYMFYKCKNLVYVGDLSSWDVSKVKNMFSMFDECKKLESIGDLSGWTVSKVEDMRFMFHMCENLKSIGDLSGWDISNVEEIERMFYGCKQLKFVGDLSDWKVSKVENMGNMFYDSGITNIPDWYKG